MHFNLYFTTDLLLLQIHSINMLHFSLIESDKYCKERLSCNCSENVPQQLHHLRIVDGLCSITGNSQCSDAILSLFCNAITSSNDNDTGPILTADCIKARDNECAAEWRIAEIFLNLSLIDCNSFNDNDNITSSQAPTLQCPDDFAVFCGSICQPLCSQISLFNDAVTTANKILSIMLHGMSILCGIITLVACFCRREKM